MTDPTAVYPIVAIRRLDAADFVASLAAASAIDCLHTPTQRPLGVVPGNAASFFRRTIALNAPSSGNWEA